MEVGDEHPTLRRLSRIAVRAEATKFRWLGSKVTGRIRAWELGGTGFRAGDSKYGEGEEAEPERHRRREGRPGRAWQRRV